MSTYGPIILGAVLAAVGWFGRKLLNDGRQQDHRLNTLERSVARIEGILSMAFPHAAERVKQKQEDDDSE